MDPSATDPLVGHVVDGRYEVHARIATGGMATVYLAVDRRLEREVALKVLHPHLADTTTGDFVSRFRREARTVARLVHPGLVQIFDQGVDGTTTYLAMEYVEGTTLRQLLIDHGALPLGESLNVVERLLEALATAHHAGLVHRDVKPENVLLGTDGRIKLADFGLARAVTEMTSGSSVVMGTAAYLAPELISVGTADARTDVYAIGVLLYEVLTGCQPFFGPSPVQVAFMHVHNDIPLPSDQAAWMPAEMDELVRALAARDPSNRPADAATALAMVKHLRNRLDADMLARTVTYADHPPPRAPEQITPISGREPAEVATPQVGLAPATFAPTPTFAPPTAFAPPPPDPTHASAAGLIPGFGPLAPEPGPASQTYQPSYLHPGQPTEPEPLSEESRRNLMIMAIGLVILMLFSIGGLGVWYFGKGPGGQATVPDVVGMSQADAEAKVRKANLDPDVKMAFDRTVPEGKVISTDPPKGKRMSRGSQVTVMVSKGPDYVELPDIAGMSVAGATDALTKEGLVVAPTTTEDYHDSVERGAVMGITLPGDKAIRGDTVTIVVSKGPAPVTVPYVVGMGETEAAEALAEVGLKMSSTDSPSDRPVGEVLSQSPEDGVEAHRGDTIEVTVSNGVQLIPVPDVTFMTSDRAVTELSRAGFVGVVQGRDRGLIMSQDPPGGSMRAPGSIVNLFSL